MAVVVMKPFGGITMPNITTQVADSSSFGQAPIRVGSSSFSRPAALIGGATALIALTAIATTLVVRPAAQHTGDPAAEARVAAVAAQSLLASPSPSPSPAPTTNKAAGTVESDKPAPNDGDEKPEPKVAAKPPLSKPAPRAQAPHHSGNTTTAAASPAAPEHRAAAPACATCGVVESVAPFKQKGEGSGVGAVAGGVLGGVVGHQVGGGNGRKAMTVLGAIGGGLAGNEIEKRQRSTTLYSVKVRMEDGSLRSVTQQTAPTVGEKVTVDGSQIRARG
jgi:outer membrane lipoprotein SlyB